MSTRIGRELVAGDSCFVSVLGDGDDDVLSFKSNFLSHSSSFDIGMLLMGGADEVTERKFKNYSFIINNFLHSPSDSTNC